MVVCLANMTNEGMRFNMLFAEREVAYITDLAKVEIWGHNAIEDQGQGQSSSPKDPSQRRPLTERLRRTR
jgi:hypothetical protein